MFYINQKVWANQHIATIVLIIDNKYLVQYSDGVGSDWMDETCLKKIDVKD